MTAEATMAAPTLMGKNKVDTTNPFLCRYKQTLWKESLHKIINAILRGWNYTALKLWLSIVSC